MMQVTMKMISALIFGGLLATGAYAAPITLNDAQLDGVAAGGMYKVDGFVCPVITTDGVLHSPNGAPLGDTGHYTIGGPDVSVPAHATNTLDNGEYGVPPGPHAAPGDTGYTAIWNREAL